MLAWDREDEGPPLFGRVADTYSMRRLWGGGGVFWHWGGDTVPVEGLLPGPSSLGGAGRTLRLFVGGAVVHAVVNGGFKGAR